MKKSAFARRDAGCILEIEGGDVMHIPATRLPRSLQLLRQKCAELFEKEHCVLACENEIFIERNGDVNLDEVRLFILPYDLSLVLPYHYLWDELHRIEYGITASGYSRRELTQLTSFMEGMAHTLDHLPNTLDRDKARTLKTLNLLN